MIEKFKGDKIYTLFDYNKSDKELRMHLTGCEETLLVFYGVVKFHLKNYFEGIAVFESEQSSDILLEKLFLLKTRDDDIDYYVVALGVMGKGR